MSAYDRALLSGRLWTFDTHKYRDGAGTPVEITYKVAPSDSEITAALSRLCAERDAEYAAPAVRGEFKMTVKTEKVVSERKVPLHKSSAVLVNKPAVITIHKLVVERSAAPTAASGGAGAAGASAEPDMADAIRAFQAVVEAALPLEYADPKADYGVSSAVLREYVELKARIAQIYACDPLGDTGVSYRESAFLPLLLPRFNALERTLLRLAQAYHNA